MTVCHVSRSVRRVENGQRHGASRGLQSQHGALQFNGRCRSDRHDAVAGKGVTKDHLVQRQAEIRRMATVLEIQRLRPKNTLLRRCRGRQTAGNCNSLIVGCINGHLWRDGQGSGFL
jgi:hypothetical protein